MNGVARVPVRVAVVCLGLAAVVFAAGVFVVGTGELAIAPLEVVQALFGRGSQAHRFIVTELRLPRALTGLLVGSALGLGGAVFQSLSRNPLGSPDLIGFTTGAASGALVQILLVGGGTAAIAASAVGGAALTGAVVYLLAYRGGVHGYRLVLVGVGVAAMLEALNSYLITRAELREAYEAAFWLTGSLDGRDWDHVRALSVALLVLLPLTLALSRPLRMAELGDDVARALGLRVEQTRGLAVLSGVGLVAVATAAAGPVAFVALAAPQLARRLTRGSGPHLLPSALMGAALLVVSDLIALRLPVRLPVGVVTSVLGGVYLVWLLAVEGRRER